MKNPGLKTRHDAHTMPRLGAQAAPNMTIVPQSTSRFEQPARVRTGKMKPIGGKGPKVKPTKGVNTGKGKAKTPKAGM